MIDDAINIILEDGNKIAIVLSDMRYYASIGMSLSQIAESYGIDIELLSECDELIAEYRIGHLGYVSEILAAQKRQALKGQPQVLIHLGKTVLHQAEREESHEEAADREIEIQHRIITDDTPTDNYTSINNKKSKIKTERTKAMSTRLESTLPL